MNEAEFGGLSQDGEPYEVSLERMREAKRIAGERRREGGGMSADWWAALVGSLTELITPDAQRIESWRREKTE